MSPVRGGLRTHAQNGHESVCKRGPGLDCWAVCSCQTRGVHSRDGGGAAGHAGSGLGFENPFLTFMHEAAAQSRGPDGINLQHEGVVEDVTIGVAAGLSHTYEGQPKALNGGMGVVLGLSRA